MGGGWRSDTDGGSRGMLDRSHLTFFFPFFFISYIAKSPFNWVRAGNECSFVCYI